MPIPEQVIHILEGPTWTHVGTRDASLLPAHHIAWGARPAADREHVEALILDLPGGRLAANVADNGQVALTVGEPISHATYQLKGRLVEIRPSNDDDRAFQRGWAERLLNHIQPVMPAHLIAILAKFAAAPTTYVRVRIEEVYDQTPGPGAGARLPLEG